HRTARDVCFFAALAVVREAVSDRHQEWIRTRVVIDSHRTLERVGPRAAVDDVAEDGATCDELVPARPAVDVDQAERAGEHVDLVALVAGCELEPEAALVLHGGRAGG